MPFAHGPVPRRGDRRFGGGEVDDAVAGGALLEQRLAAQPVEDLRRERHVAGLAGAVGRLGDGRAALGPDHLVAPVELRGQRLDGDLALAALALELAVDLTHLRPDVALARRELLLELLVLGARGFELLASG